MVLLCIFDRVSMVGADGLMKSVSFVTCLNMPGGKVPVSRAVCMICL